MGIAVEQQQFLFLISLLLVVCVPMSFRKLSTSTSFFLSFYPFSFSSGFAGSWIQYHNRLRTLCCCQLADILVIASFSSWVLLCTFTQKTISNPQGED
jgi:hypothetical protein